MRGLRETISWYRWAYDLKGEISVALCEKWQDLVEFKERAWPAMDKHKRYNLLILLLRWPHMDKMHIYSCWGGEQFEE